MGATQMVRVLRPWHVHLATGTIKAALPFQSALRHFWRQAFPYRSNPKNDIGLLVDAARQVQLLHECGFSLRGKIVVEIGTGWLPITPLVYRSAGAASVITIDQERLLDKHTLIAAQEYFRQNLPAAVEKFGFDENLLDRQFVPSDPDASLEMSLQDLGIRYLAPFDFNDLPDGSADFIVSRTVLEHISPDLLKMVFSNSRRILREGGALCHSIDMSDHFEHNDKSISRLNFLRYSERVWKITQLNPQFYQNRLRRNEYVSMLQEAGFSVHVVTGSPDMKAKSDLKAMELCSRYADWNPDELAILVSTIVATPAGHG
ncbi:MAG TPA: class I SAM-dependent methyltransferase [Rhizomicrobium sp.]|jgi:SAM-dependent methyltransferase|nr:class I SAM-dependent methyltransferase [Rhizomicrobium sp.]